MWRSGYLTGFCSHDASADSHVRCRGDYTASGGAACTCGCHRLSDPWAAV